MLLLPYGPVPLALVERLFQWSPRLWIAPIFQLPITMYDMVTAPLQFFSNRSFAGARNPFDQIVSDAHPVFSTTEQDWSSSAWLTACLPIFDHLQDILNLPRTALNAAGNQTDRLPNCGGYSLQRLHQCRIARWLVDNELQ